MTDVPKKLRRAKLLHSCEEHGTTLLAENDDGKGEIMRGEIARDGKPIPAGSTLWQLRQENLGGDLTMEKIVDIPPAPNHKGPSRASNPRYREGYEATFGSKKNELPN